MSETITAAFKEKVGKRSLKWREEPEVFQAGHGMSQKKEIGYTENGNKPNYRYRLLRGCDFGFKILKIRGAWAAQ